MRIASCFNRKMLLVCGLLLVTLIAGCGMQITSGEIGGDMQAAIMPGAHLIVYYDLDAIRNTAISEAFKELGDTAGAIGQDLQGQDIGMMQERFKEVTGLSDDDFSAFVLAVNLDGIDMDAPEPPAFSELDMVIAVSLKKAVSGDKLVEFIQAMAAEQGEEALISQTTHNGTTIYTFSDMDAGQPGMTDVAMDVVSMAMIGNDKVCLIGSGAALMGAIDRAASGDMAELSAEMTEIQKTVRSGAQAYAAFVLTPEIRSRLVEDLPPASPDDPMAAWQNALGGLRGASISMSMGREADMTLASVFDDQETAGSMTAFFDNVLISTVRMFAGMMLGPRPMPMLQSLKATHDGNKAVLSFTVAEQDIKTLQELSAAGGPPVFF